MCFISPRFLLLAVDDKHDKYFHKRSFSERQAKGKISNIFHHFDNCCVHNYRIEHSFPFQHQILLNDWIYVWNQGDFSVAVIL